MKKNQKPHEKFLYEIWKEQKFVKSLSTHDGRTIEIIDVGIENSELGGPDFKNARIKIGNITYVGDIEIDIEHSDWKTHGHSLSKNYNSVILHATLNNDSKQSFVYTQNGRRVDTVYFGEIISQPLKDSIAKAINSERKKRINKMPCIELNQLVQQNQKLDFIFDLGLDRFKKKREKIFERLKELVYLKELKLKEPVVRYELTEDFYRRKFTKDDFTDKDVWQQLAYEMIFEALGYSKNKNIMLQLSKALEISFLKKFRNSDDFLILIEAALLNAGGLVPDIKGLTSEASLEYVRKISEYWEKIKPEYDGKTFDETQWHFYKLRPPNFPTIRLAGGARIIYKMLKEDLFSKVIRKFKEINNLKTLSNSVRSLFIIKGEGFWKDHFVFDKPSNVEIRYFIGLSRADEILVNVIMPYVSLYFEIFDKKELSKKIVKLFSHYNQSSENNLVTEISSTLSLGSAARRSILHQGMIELFRTYCSKNRCPECSIGRRVFA